jgi:hypothetical protein
MLFDDVYLEPAPASDRLYSWLIDMSYTGEIGYVSDRLQKVTIPTADRGRCGVYMRGPVFKAMVCASYFEDRGKGACRRNCSGPLFSGNGTVVGIVIGSQVCARSGGPSMYINVVAV